MIKGDVKYYKSARVLVLKLTKIRLKKMNHDRTADILDEGTGHLDFNEVVLGEPCPGDHSGLIVVKKN